MEELVKRAKAGDQSAINRIFADYKGLVKSVANQFFLVGGDKDDLLQEGMIGLYYAINNFDENKGSFPAFAKLCMVRQIADTVKSDGSVKNKPLRDYIEISSVENMAMEKTPVQMLLDKEFSEKFVQIKQNLTPKEKQAVELYSEGYSYEDIADKMEISSKAVDGALQRARKKLQRLLNKEQV